MSEHQPLTSHYDTHGQTIVTTTISVHDKLDIQVDEDVIHRNVDIERELRGRPEFDPDSVDVDQMVEWIEEIQQSAVLRQIAARIVDEQYMIEPAKRVLWVGDSVPAFLCESCHESNRKDIPKGEPGKPFNLRKFQEAIESRLDQGCSCEYCREAAIGTIIEKIESDIEVGIEVDTELSNP